MTARAAPPVPAPLPDCQRQLELGKVSLSGLEIELFASGPDDASAFDLGYPYSFIQATQTTW